MPHSSTVTIQVMHDYPEQEITALDKVVLAGRLAFILRKLPTGAMLLREIKSDELPDELRAALALVALSETGRLPPVSPPARAARSGWLTLQPPSIH